MIKECDTLTIPISSSQYGLVKLNIVASSSKAKMYVEDETSNGVSAYQLVEGAS